MDYELGTDYRLDHKLRSLLDIPDIELDPAHEEIWRYAIYDKHEEMNKERLYLVSNYGRVYDTTDRRMVPIYKGQKNTQGDNYRYVKCDFKSIKQVSPYYLHRIVALTFLDPVEGKTLVKHIDGCRGHNYVWNLKWCDASENMTHTIKTGLKVDKKGEQRTAAIWSDEEIHMVCQMIADGHKASYIYNILAEQLKDPKIQYERVRNLYKHITHKKQWTHISSQYDIDFTRYNYMKEKKSVSAKKIKENKISINEAING